MHIASIGVDLGKTTFHLVALGEQGKVIVRKKFSRKQLLAYTANLQSSLVGMEACSGAHFIGAALRSQGHDVRVIPAQFVKPYVKSNKNDFLDNGGVVCRDRWRCQSCGSMTNLEVHHQEFRSHSGADSEQNLITLCSDCHAAIHSGALKSEHE
ncbi:MAG: HNH endonuclease [Candidatus Sulfotelmatobacter sp.]|jgi:hypothetical protein